MSPFRESFFELAIDLALVVSREGKIVAANPAWREILGWDPRELAGMRFLDLIHPEDVERTRIEGRRMVISKRAFDLEARVRQHPDGYRMIRWRGSASADGSEILAIGRDFVGKHEITERAGLLGHLVEHLAEGIQLLSEEGLVVYSNIAHERMFGYAPGEQLGRHIKEFYRESGAERDRIYDEINRVLAEQGFWRGSRWHLRKDGSVIETDTYITTFTSQGRRYSVNVRQDLTERRRTEKLIAEQNAKMVAISKMSSLGEMASGIAHEINNPLAVIHVRASQLLERASQGDVPSAEARGAAEKIEYTAIRISKIVKALRSFAREPDSEPLEDASLATIVEDTVEFCRSRFKSHDVRLEISLPAPPVRLACRPVQISQVLLNLLNNAHDAVLDLPEKWVRIDARETDREVELSVTDSGSGIPVEIRDKVMQPFFTTKPVGQGVGLGLSVSHGIIVAHQGTLRIDTSSAHTRFVIALPHSVKAAPRGGGA